MTNETQYQFMPSTQYLLGVAFKWSCDRGGEDVTRRGGGDDAEAVTKYLAQLSKERMHRQKRSSVTYVDAMTAICEGEPSRLLKSDAFHLAADLSLAVESGTIPDHLFMDIADYEPIQKLKQSFRNRLEASNSPRVLPESIRSIGNIETAGTGRDGIGEGNIRRYLELPMEGDPATTDWQLLSLYAVLVHLKCDLEVLLDTGFLPVRRCQRHRCGAFYRVNRMSGRSRFCSDTCRASAPREQAT